MTYPFVDISDKKRLGQPFSLRNMLTREQLLRFSRGSESISVLPIKNGPNSDHVSSFTSSVVIEADVIMITEYTSSINCMNGIIAL